jgi:hypothetical protein
VKRESGGSQIKFRPHPPTANSPPRKFGRLARDDEVAGEYARRLRVGMTFEAGLFAADGD